MYRVCHKTISTLLGTWGSGDIHLSLVQTLSSPWQSCSNHCAHGKLPSGTISPVDTNRRRSQRTGLSTQYFCFCLPCISELPFILVPSKLVQLLDTVFNHLLTYRILSQIHFLCNLLIFNCPYLQIKSKSSPIFLQRCITFIE